MVPLENYGIKCISMGFLMEERDAAVWRGPMVMGAVDKLLRGVKWGHLDVLVVDMPPGTGDAHISLSQKVRLTGAVVVSTPQDLALIDARRGVALYHTMHVPVLGLVENMSFYLCPKCGHQANIFGHGGVKAEAEELGVRLLGQVRNIQSPEDAKRSNGWTESAPRVMLRVQGGQVGVHTAVFGEKTIGSVRLETDQARVRQVPLQMQVRELSDAGKPVVLAAPDSPAAVVYRRVAASVAERLREELVRAGGAGPPIKSD